MSVFMDPASMAKRSDLNPPEKFKIPIKYIHIFLTSEQLLHTYYENAHSWFEIMEFSRNYDHFYFPVLENGYKVKVVKFVVKLHD